MVNFYISDIQKEMFNQRIRDDNNFIKCFRNNISDMFFKDIKNRDSTIIWVYGLTGSGKSAFSQALMLMMDSDFISDRICMTNDELKTSVYNSNVNDGFIRDETAKDFGEGSGQTLSTIQDIVETLRQRRNSFILLSPVIKGQGFVHYYIEILQSSVPLDYFRVKEFIKSGGKEITFRAGVQDNRGNYLGYVLLSSEINNSLWLDYQVKKERFLKDMSSGDRKTGLDYTKEADNFLEQINLNEYPRKQDRLTFIKTRSNFTLGQCKSIHSEMERLILIRGLIINKNKKISWWERVKIAKNNH